MTPAIFKESRRRIGLSQEDLAKHLGLSTRQIQNLEKGISPIKGVHELALRWVAMEESNLTLPYEYQKDAFEGQ